MKYVLLCFFFVFLYFRDTRCVIENEVAPKYTQAHRYICDRALRGASCAETSIEFFNTLKFRCFYDGLKPVMQIVRRC